MKKLSLLLVCALLLTGCAARETGGQGGVVQLADKPPVLESDTSAFNRLLDGLLADGDLNACISPLSLKFALAMAYNGAQGSTAELLAQLFDVSPAEMNAWASAYLERAKVYDGLQPDAYSAPNGELRIANSFWLRKGRQGDIADVFKNTLKASYQAESGTFAEKPDPINKWVSQATNNKIKDILADVDPNAVSYLVNALYFQAQWVNEFWEGGTAPGEFTNYDGSKVTTAMLNGNAESYIDTAKYSGAAKNLRGGFVFTAFMSKTSDPVTLDSLLEAQKTKDNSGTTVFVLPKFDLETGVNLQKGNHPEFDALFADQGMNGALAAKADGSLNISKVVHKTTFTLAEAGIEASAATAIVVAENMAPQETEKRTIVFNKPFYFMLSDQNGEVLFMGRVTNL